MSIDPLAEGYVYNSPYAFAENKVVSNFELEGLEAKIAIYGDGAGANYKPEDKKSFKSRANNLGSSGYSSPTKVNNGQQLLTALKSATAKEGSIQQAVIFGHGGYNGLYVDKDEGFYRNNASESGANRALVSDLAGAIKDGSIKFENSGSIIFGMCNASNNSEGETSIADEITGTTGITTIGATGYVSQEANGKGGETNFLTTDGTFIKTERFFDVNVTGDGGVISTHTFSSEKAAWNFANKLPQYETTVNSRIQKTDLGNRINPNDY